jgi:hypothetical protein
MRSICSLALLLACLHTPLAGFAAEEMSNDLVDAEKILKEEGIGTDGPALLAYLKQLQATPADAEKIAALVKQLGSNDFDDREKATRELAKIGKPATAALKKALADGDAEVRRRAQEVLDGFDKSTRSGVPLCVVRVLADRRPAGTCGALLDYLPLAEGNDIEEEILATLLAAGGQPDKLDPALVKALDDKHAGRRSCAALVVGFRGKGEEKKQVARLLGDADPKVRLRAAQGLLAAKDRQAVPALVALLTDAPLEVAQSAEETLTRLADAKQPPVALGRTAEMREKCKTEWEAWWKKEGEKLDLAALPLEPLGNPITQAKRVAREFMDGMIQRDLTRLKNSIDAPFSLMGMQNFATRGDVERFLDMMLKQARNDKLSGYTIQKVEKADEVARQLPPQARGLFEGHKMSELRVVNIDGQQGGRTESAFLVVRIRGGRAQVVGLGTKDFPK